MKLTKEQRRKCYKSSLSNLGIDGEIFLCYLLAKACYRETGFNPSIKMIPLLFPEFGKRKPKDYGQYIGWWAMSDYDVRGKVLKQCIRETTPKRKSKVKPI